MNQKNKSPRDNILGRLRQNIALSKQESLPIRSIKTPEADLIDIFSVEFSLAAGQLYTVANTEEVAELIAQLCEKNQWQSLFCPEDDIKNLLPLSLFDTLVTEKQADKADAAFTSCQALIAEFGAILVQAAQTRKATVLAPNHIVIAYQKQLVYNIVEALANTPSTIQTSMQSIITGPSRTADIEKTLVMGAHGSKSLHLILII
jgi:L-lactate dehydrogenase complex protein LldG